MTDNQKIEQVDARCLDGYVSPGNGMWADIHQNEAYARLSLALDGREITESAVSNEVFALMERAQERIKNQQIAVREAFFADRRDRPMSEIRDGQVPMTTANIHDGMRAEVADRVANYDPLQNGGRVLEFVRQPKPPVPDMTNQRYYGPGSGFDL